MVSCQLNCLHRISSYNNEFLVPGLFRMDIYLTHTHQSAITLKSLTGDVNNVYYFVTMVPVKDWSISVHK